MTLHLELEAAVQRAATPIKNQNHLAVEVRKNVSSIRLVFEIAIQRCQWLVHEGFNVYAGIEHCFAQCLPTPSVQSHRNGHYGTCQICNLINIAIVSISH